MPVLRPIRNESAMPAPAAAMLACLLALAAPSHAQEPAQLDPPAHFAVVDGDASLRRDLEDGPADPGMPVVPGDSVRTTRGRAAILFPDGSALDLDEYSRIDLQARTLVSLLEGRLRLTIPRESPARFIVDTPAGTVRVDEPGEYRVALLGTTYGQVELTVVRGAAELEGMRDRVRLTAGERSLAWTDDEPTRPERVNVARLDEFDRWSASQREERTAGYSSRYLPPDLRAYGGEFDRQGQWQYDSSYGYVWYPRVDTAWRPYFSGYWTSVPAFGWTWVGLERWAWPTHHYGRWGYGSSRWFWIPDRRWAPAWVSWGSAPGYVGWSPLGWDNRPIFPFSLGAGSRGALGWVVLPNNRFGVRGAAAHRFAVEPRSLSPRTGFVTRSAPPPTPRRGTAWRGTAPRDGDTGSAPRARDDERRGGIRGDRRPGPDRNSGGTLSGGPGAVSGPAVPRAPVAPASPGMRRAVPRGGTAEDTVRAPRPYPFGDFRRWNSGGTASAPAPDVPDATSAPPADNDGRPASRPDRARDGGRSGRTRERVYSSPGAGDSRATPRENAPGVGPSGIVPATGAGRRAPSGPGLGSTEGRPGDGGGTFRGRPAQPRGDAPAGRSSGGPGSAVPRGDQRAHDPGARRPPR